MVWVTHPLNRLSLSLCLVCSITYLFISTLCFDPLPVQNVKLHCFESKEGKEKSHAGLPDKRVRLLSWDVGALNTNENRLKKEGERVLNTLRASIDAAQIDGPKVIFISLQGVPSRWRRSLEQLLVHRGGCWGYAPLWRPSWILRALV